MTELLLDERIMWWVFLPIVYVTFMLSMARMFYMKWQAYNRVKSPVLQRGQQRDNNDKNIMVKCDLLIKKNAFLSKSAFEVRKSFLCQPETGYLVKPRQALENGEQADPMAQMHGMMENMGGTLPTIFISIATIGWINYAFGGILMAKVPFNLSQQFKAITQSGIDMENLNVQYISGISFYILIMSGLGQIYNLFLKEEEDAADLREAAARRNRELSASPSNPMMGGSGANPMNPMMPNMAQPADPNQQQQQQDPKEKFKQQIQNLSLVKHHFAFENCHKSAVDNLRKFLSQN